MPPLWRKNLHPIY